MRQYYYGVRPRRVLCVDRRFHESCHMHSRLRDNRSGREYAGVSLAVRKESKDGTPAIIGPRRWRQIRYADVNYQRDIKGFGYDFKKVILVTACDMSLVFLAVSSKTSLVGNWSGGYSNASDS